MAFQGSLAELHLPDIIQLISVSGKTGVFHLTDGRQRGEIYLNEGKIVHAAARGRQRRGGGLCPGHLAAGRVSLRAGRPHRPTDHHQEQHEPAHGGRASPRRMARALEEDSLHRPRARVRDAGDPRGTDQPEHQRVADPLEDRRPTQREGHRRGQRPLRLRRGQDALRPRRRRPHPAQGAGRRTAAAGARRPATAAGGPRLPPGRVPSAAGPGPGRRAPGAASPACATRAAPSSARSARPW